MLSPAAWRPVTALLERGGWCTAIAPLPAAITCAADVQATFDSVLCPDEDLVLVAHSNAGLFVPWLAGRHRVTACVFVDAALPQVAGAAQLSPPDFYDFLAGMADEKGNLPPWTEWWSACEVRRLVPDVRTRDQLARQAQRLPLSYFRESVPVPAGWDHIPCGYLAFGDTYAAERAHAHRSRWPVRTLPGRHLHMLVDPEAVATAVAEILALLLELPD